MVRLRLRCISSIELPLLSKISSLHSAAVFLATMQPPHSLGHQITNAGAKSPQDVSSDEKSNTSSTQVTPNSYWLGDVQASAVEACYNSACQNSPSSAEAFPETSAKIRGPGKPRQISRNGKPKGSPEVGPLKVSNKYPAPNLINNVLPYDILRIIMLKLDEDALLLRCQTVCKMRADLIPGYLSI